MSREEFLERVRTAVRQGNAHRVAIQPFDEHTGYVGAGDDLCAAMAKEVELVGGQAIVVQGREAARGAIEELLGRHQIRRALCWKHPRLDALGLPPLLEQAGVESRDYDALRDDIEAARAYALDADLGITSTDWAIAETGSLMLCARAGQERMASLLPPRHLAIVFEDQIVPDLLDAFQQLRARHPDQLPSNVVLVTGPSKTGDIELQLTTGVHGPGHWHVLIVK